MIQFGPQYRGKENAFRYRIYIDEAIVEVNVYYMM